MAGLDLGIKHDHSAFVVLGVQDGENRIRVASVQSWRPPRGGQVDLAAVEKYIIEQHRRYSLRKVLFDPSQALYLAQRLGAGDFMRAGRNRSWRSAISF